MASKQDELWKSAAVRPLSEQDVEDLSKSLGFDCPPDEVTAFTDHIKNMLKSYQRINEMTEPSLPVKYPRTPGYRPSAEENVLNAWYYKCEIKGAATGKLAGKKLAIKDNTAVAGVPMMNGSKIMEGYVPEFDATVVTRILDAGGTIVGKAACEDLCISGGGHNNSLGPVLNPVNKSHVPGGSSSGSAALVGAGEVDMATGGDQGGSIRIPASWCGTVGLKPTFGLVPYTGCVPIEMTIDHCGPIARNVRDCALLLEVLAGYDDGNDPRQPRDITVPEYSQLLTEDLHGMRIALIEEGFEGCEADVADLVKSAARKLEPSGATVETVSLPVHKDALDVWTGVIVEGISQTMVRDNCHSPGWKGQYFTSMLDKLAQGYASRPRDNSEIVRLFVIAGEYLTNSYHGRFYAKAQNLGRFVTREYDKLLEKYDVMIMPTLPFKAPKLPTTQSTIPERLHVGLEMVKNTAPFDVTGHPSLSINVGYSEGLPVGMQITGRQFEDLTVLQVAGVMEKIRDQE